MSLTTTSISLPRLIVPLLVADQYCLLPSLAVRQELLLEFAVLLEGCVAKTGAADGRVRDGVCSLLSPCPSPTPLNGGTTRLISSSAACAGTSHIRSRTALVAEIVNERGMAVNHTTIFRWVQRYGLERRITLPTLFAPNQ